MSFQIRKTALINALEEGVEAIRIIPYFNYGVCLKVYKDNRYEIWNYESIPLDKVAKIVCGFLDDRKDIKKLYVGNKAFVIPENNAREELLNFLIKIQEEEIK